MLRLSTNFEAEGHPKKQRKKPGDHAWVHCFKRGLVFGFLFLNYMGTYPSRKYYYYFLVLKSTKIFTQALCNMPTAGMGRRDCFSHKKDRGGEFCFLNRTAPELPNQPTQPALKTCLAITISGVEASTPPLYHSVAPLWFLGRLPKYVKPLFKLRRF